MAYSTNVIDNRDFWIDGTYYRGKLLASQKDYRTMNTWYEYGLPGGELRYIVNNGIEEEEFDAKGFDFFLKGKRNEFKTLTNLRK